MTSRTTKSMIILLISGLFLTACSVKGSEPMPNNAYNTLHSKIADLTVNNLDDQAVAVDSLWEDRRVVLVFLRHYG